MFAGESATGNTLNGEGGEDWLTVYGEAPAAGNLLNGGEDDDTLSA